MNIVLAHGFFGFRNLLGINYFNGVKEDLEQAFADVRVLDTEVNPVARIELRGGQLSEKILAAFDSGELRRDEKVHIIAHSMGGLDARFGLSPANPKNIAANVASLTTISTPHRGSPGADVLTAGNLADRLDLGLARFAAGLSEFAHRLDLSVAGIQDLTSRAAERFNAAYPDPFVSTTSATR